MAEERVRRQLGQAVFEELGLTEARRIGKGGSANVYAAIDPVFGPVAVKVLQRVGPNPVRRFQREVEALSVLDDVPGVLRVLGTGQTSSGQPLIIMPLMVGSLQDVVRDWGPLGWIQAAEAVADVAETVHQAHLRGVIHADLKPENLLLDEGNNLYVSDFGIAKLAAPSGPTVSTPGWTPAYAAPEVAAGQRATRQADVYGLGATLAALVTGSPTAASDPDGQSFRAMVEGVATLIPSDQGVEGVEIAEVVSTAMAEDPADRYQSAEELANVLRAGLQRVQGRSRATIMRRVSGGIDGPGSVVEPPTVIEADRARSHRRPFLLVGLLALLGAAGVGAAFRIADRSDVSASGGPSSSEAIGSVTVEQFPTSQSQEPEPTEDVEASPGAVCRITLDPDGTDLVKILADSVPGQSICLNAGTYTSRRRWRSGPMSPSEAPRRRAR